MKRSKTQKLLNLEYQNWQQYSDQIPMHPNFFGLDFIPEMLVPFAKKLSHSILYNQDCDSTKLFPTTIQTQNTPFDSISEMFCRVHIVGCFRVIVEQSSLADQQFHWQFELNWQANWVSNIQNLIKVRLVQCIVSKLLAN